MSAIHNDIGGEMVTEVDAVVEAHQEGVGISEALVRNGSHITYNTSITVFQ
jgi:hypothetical protein